MALGGTRWHLVAPNWHPMAHRETRVYDLRSPTWNRAAFSSIQPYFIMLTLCARCTCRSDRSGSGTRGAPVRYVSLYKIERE